MSRHTNTSGCVYMSADGCEKMKYEKISQMNKWVGRMVSATRMGTCKYWLNLSKPEFRYSETSVIWNYFQCARIL